MKLNLILTICIFNIITNSFKVSLIQNELPITWASSSANSLSIGNDYTETSINVKATATEGNKADATSSADAKTNILNNQISAKADANAFDHKLVENAIYKEKISTHKKNLISNLDLSSESIKVNQFEENSKRTVTKQDEDINEMKISSQVDKNNKYYDESQNIKDKTFDLSTIENFSNRNKSSNYLSQSQKREILITIDAGSEKLIIERIIGNDNRVLIVSAAKYLKKSLSNEIKHFFKGLYDQQCNCKLIREYAMDMLAESE